MAIQFAPFGTYTSAEVIAAPLKAELTANMNSLKTLIPAPGAVSSGTPAPHPDFDKIHPATADKLRAEIDAIIAAIAAA